MNDYLIEGKYEEDSESQTMKKIPDKEGGGDLVIILD
jgi:hypothetical protein